MTAQFHTRVRAELESIDAQGLTKPERVIASRQGPVITVGGREVLNFCANNYLGLGGEDRVARAGIAATERWGSGTASVRFICGTLEIHKELEAAIAGYLGFEDAILFAAAFDKMRISYLAQHMLPWTWAAFIGAVITGGLMFMANAVGYATKVPFLIKMGLLLGAGLNMVYFQLVTYRGVAGWDVGRPPAAARMAGFISMVCWIGVVAFGRWIGFV